MKKGLIILGLLFVSVLAYSEEASGENNKRSEFSLSLDMKTQHTWRGGLTTEQFNFQPAFVYSKNNFFAGVWSIFSQSGDYAELDFYAGYKISRLTIALYDYYCPGGFRNINSNIFRYTERSSSPHSFDFSVDYTISEKFPLNILVSTFLYNNVKANGKESLSTYGELSYTKDVKKFKVKGFVGGTPHESSYSNSGVAIINTGVNVTYPIEIANYELPFYVSLVANPKYKTEYLMFGLSLSL
jgi:hypothetical protein